MTDDLPPEPSSAASAVPERARIEAPPPAHRMDALPILYLVGFLILAGASIYVWRHPTASGASVHEADAQRGEIAALSARVHQLEARPAPDVPSLQPLDARVTALEARTPPAPADLGPLDARVKALEARTPPAPVDLGPLEARVAAVEARKPVDLGPVETRLGALDDKVAGLEKQEAAASDAVGALRQQLAAVEAQGKQTASGLAAINERAARAGRVMAATAALAAGQPLGELAGAPPSVAQFAHQAPPTEASLRLSFDRAADAAHAASQPAITDNQSFVDRMWTRAQQSVTVRQGERVLVGDPIAGVIAGARQALDAGDLQGAVTALGGLSGPAKAAMAPWVAQAQALLDARAGLAALAAR